MLKDCTNNADDANIHNKAKHCFCLHSDRDYDNVFKKIFLWFSKVCFENTVAK